MLLHPDFIDKLRDYLDNRVSPVTFGDFELHLDARFYTHTKMVSIS